MHGDPIDGDGSSRDRDLTRRPVLVTGRSRAGLEPVAKLLSQRRHRHELPGGCRRQNIARTAVTGRRLLATSVAIARTANIMVLPPVWKMRGREVAPPRCRPGTRFRRTAPPRWPRPQVGDRSGRRRTLSCERVSTCVRARLNLSGGIDAKSCCRHARVSGGGDSAETVAEIAVDVADELMVVDDSSRDKTAELAREMGIPVHVHPENRGYGGNQKTRYSEPLSDKADVVILLHPDYQYDSRALPLLIAPILSGHADMTFQ